MSAWCLQLTVLVRTWKLKSMLTWDSRVLTWDRRVLTWDSRVLKCGQTRRA